VVQDSDGISRPSQIHRDTDYGMLPTIHRLSYLVSRQYIRQQGEDIMAVESEGWAENEEDLTSRRRVRGDYQGSKLNFYTNTHHMTLILCFILNLNSLFGHWLRTSQS
jgi:hypothetical protein